MDDLRLYTFTNFYLSSIQAGIQTAHVVGELFNRYSHDDEEAEAFEMLVEWNFKHKTIIVLSAGANEDLYNIKAFLKAGGLPGYTLDDDTVLPYAWFHEDERSLGGILTCVGIVLPAPIFNAVRHKTMLQLVPSKLAALQYQGQDDWFYVEDGEIIAHYPAGSKAAELLEVVKECGLAR